MLDSRANPRIRATAADVAGHERVDIFVGGILVDSEQCGGRHHLAGLAIAALRHVQRENNHYAMGTSIARTSNIVDITRLAEGYDMPADSIDGMSAEAVHEGVIRGVKRAREKGGPTLLEIKTYRYKGHSISDPAKYRSKEELEEYKEKDPIQQLKKTMLEGNFATEEEIKTIDKRVEGIVSDSVKFAEESPWPDADELLKDVYVDKSYPFIVD